MTNTIRVASMAAALLSTMISVRFAAAAPPSALPAKGTGQSDGPREMVVAPDGSGTYKTVQEAIAAAPTGTREQPTVIHIKPGNYREVLYVQREKRFLRIVGDDPATTTITYGLYANVPGPDGKPIGTFRTATATFDADDLTVENLTIANDSGPKGQALAVRVDGDRVVFRNCHLTGWQDTLLDNRGRHFYTDCTITGATDFIFGGGTGFFEHCRLVCAGNGYITAASTPDDTPYGFVFSLCTIAGASPEVKTYLGRPWRDYAQTVFLNTQMSDVVRPEGWSNWGHTGRDKTARYGEYHNFGPGAAATGRVPWAKKWTAAEADALTPERVLSGTDHWNPRAGQANGGMMTTDIPYGEAEGERLLLDASVPDGDGPFPIVILIHGGGWSSGYKQGDMAPLLGPLLSPRFTWFTIDYRLAPRHRWPACQDDVATAIRWVKAHAAEYKGDPNRIALIGYSAGGQLACRAAVATDADTRISAAVGLAAPTDLAADTARRGGLSKSLQDLFGRTSEAVDEDARSKMQEMSAIEHVPSGAPPFLLVHGTADKSVPYDQSIAFQKRLKQAGTTCDLLTLPDAPHAIAQWEQIDPKWQASVVNWLTKTLAATP